MITLAAQMLAKVLGNDTLVFSNLSKDFAIKKSIYDSLEQRLNYNDEEKDMVEKNAFSWTSEVYGSFEIKSHVASEYGDF